MEEHASSGTIAGHSIALQEECALMYVNAAYAVLLAFFGLQGYLKRGSKASLIASVAFALLFLYAAYMIYSGHPARGHKYSFLAGLGLALVMGYRFYQSGKFMPAGLVALMSSGMVLRALLALNALGGLKSRL